MHAREKQRAQLILSLCALRFSCAYVASIALHTTAWKLTFKSIFCISTAAALFRCSAHVGLRQPAIAKFFFYDGGAVCEIR